MRIGSLFSGIGGLELGLEWAGVGRTVWQVEQDPFCLDVLAHHWPDAARYSDVRDVGAHNLAPVDVICGGFPCQDISYAGKGAGLAGARSGLWYEFARIVGEMGPQYVVVENVGALLTRGIGDVLGTLASLRYDAEWSTLRASDVGAPHRRERVFIVAYRDRGGFTVERQPEWPAIEGAPGCVVDGCDASVGDSERERGRGRGVVEHAGDADASSQVVGWRDAVPVRGHDGTVRLIPREAIAENGIKSYFRGMVDGVAVWMDHTSIAELTEEIARYGETASASAAEVLRTVWGAAVSAPIQWHPGRKVAVPEETLLFTLLREYARHCGCEAITHEGPTLDGSQDDFVRSLRELRGSACPPRQPRSVGQSPGESATALQVVSPVLAQAARASWARYVDAGAAVLPRGPVVADCSGRVARLRALGNAVVPQCAEVVGRRLLEMIDSQPINR